MRFKRFFMIFSEYACLEMSILFSLAFACTNKKEPIIKSNILNLLFIIFKNLFEMIDYYCEMEHDFLQLLHHAIIDLDCLI
jgi:hypothetical protein